MSDLVRIIVADRQDLVAKGLQQLLAKEPDLQVVEHVATGQAVLQKLKEDSFDLLIIDVTLPGLDGIDTTREVKKMTPALCVLAHSSLTGIEYINSMLIEGASGYVLKGASEEEFIQAVRVVLDGGRYLSPAALEEVEKGYSHTQKHMEGEYVGLTKREKEIIKLIAQEKTNKEMADELFVSLETIKSHRKNLMTKLNVKSVAGLVKYAVDRAWV